MAAPGVQRVRRRARYLLAAASFFLSPLTRALKSEPGRNLGTDDLGTLMDAPVAGLRAVRAGRTVFSKTPNPVIATLSPLATVAWMVSSTAFTASVADFLSPIRPEIASIRSRLFISSLLRFPKREVARTGQPHPATSDVPEIRRLSVNAQSHPPENTACRAHDSMQRGGIRNSGFASGGDRGPRRISRAVACRDRDQHQEPSLHRKWP